MDEEELAFQKSLAKNYTEEMGAELDDSERCRAPRPRCARRAAAGCRQIATSHRHAPPRLVARARRERLKLLENYMETMGASLGADEGKEGEANLENVEAFLDQLSKAAAGAEGEEGDMPADLESGGAERAAEGDSGGGGGGAHAPPVEWKEVPPSR